MNRRRFLQSAASGLFVPAITGRGQVFLPARRIVAPAITSTGEPVSPLDDPDLWGFWRSDEQLYYDPGDGNKVECVTYPDPDGWVETSPTARVLAVPASCDGPVYNAAGPNGKPSVDFLNTQNSILATSGLVTISQPYSVFLLIRIDDLIGANRYIMDSEDGGGAKGALFSADANTVNMYSGSVGPTLDPTLATWIILSMIFDGASSSIQEDNDTAQTGNPGTTGCTGFGFSGWGGNPQPSNRCDFRLAAVIVTDVHSDSTWVANHKAWLAWFGGLTI